LGAIDAKYDVAISSSFSDKLKWIVVDSVQTAEKCLKVLKAKNCGRASFVVLERTGEAKENAHTPENAPRLVDLVRCKDKRFRKAFYYVLRDTLVAKDLDQANRLAFGAQRWKVVTLDGKVIDKAGTMTGGGNRVVKGGMSASLADEVRPEEIDAM
jgi:structural maintenance of chromosome 4